MPSRSYDQLCGLATALDVLGERWTLLVVRELIPGPRRFSDILDALPGISTGLLTARLKTLQEHGAVARRRLPPPAGSTVYELTGSGRQLEPAVLTLARWGLDQLEGPLANLAFRPRWTLIALMAVFQGQTIDEPDTTTVLEIDDESFTLDLRDGRVTVRDGGAPQPDVTMRTDGETFLRLAWRRDASGRKLDVQGDPAAVAVAKRMLAAVAATAATGRP